MNKNITVRVVDFAFCSSDVAAIELERMASTMNLS